MSYNGWLLGTSGKQCDWAWYMTLHDTIPIFLHPRHFKTTHVQGPSDSLLMRKRSPTSVGNQGCKQNTATIQTHHMSSNYWIRDILRFVQLLPLAPRCEVLSRHQHQQLTLALTKGVQELHEFENPPHHSDTSPLCASDFVTPGRTFFGTSTTTCSLHWKGFMSLSDTTRYTCAIFWLPSCQYHSTKVLLWQLQWIFNTWCCHHGSPKLLLNQLVPNKHRHTISTHPRFRHPNPLRSSRADYPCKQKSTTQIFFDKHHDIILDESGMGQPTSAYSCVFCNKYCCK